MYYYTAESSQHAMILVGRTPWSAADPPVGFAPQSGRPQERDQEVARRRGRLPYKTLTKYVCGYAALRGTESTQKSQDSNSALMSPRSTTVSDLSARMLSAR